MKSPVVLFPQLLVALLSGFTLHVWADDSALQEGMKGVEKISVAARSMDYSGTFVYRYGDNVETSRITHVVDAKGEHDRLERMDGERREFIRHNNQVLCFVDGHRIRVEQRQAGREFPAVLPDQLNLLNENYAIRQVGEDRVAGYPVRVVVIQPRDALRYVHKLYAESNSGLLLKSEVLDDHGKIIEQYAFTQLTIGGSIDRSWITNDPSEATSADRRRHTFKHQEPGKEELPHIAHHVPAGSDFTPINSGWRADALPPGFKKVAEVKRHMGKDGQVVQMVFSDGLVGVSLFIEKSDNDEDDQAGLYSQGVIQVYSKLVDDHLVTVVGEVPPKTAIQIGDSVRFAGE